MMVSGVAASTRGETFSAGDSFGHIELLSGGVWTQKVVAEEEVTNTLCTPATSADSITLHICQE